MARKRIAGVKLLGREGGRVKTEALHTLKPHVLLATSSKPASQPVSCESNLFHST